jgi:hypothetical protein
MGKEELIKKIIQKSSNFLTQGKNKKYIFVKFVISKKKARTFGEKTLPIA